MSISDLVSIDKDLSNMDKINWSSIESLILRAESEGGAVGVALETSGTLVFEHNGNRKFRSASTVKIPIMMEIFRQVENGDLSLSDVYVLQSDDQSVPDGILQGLHPGLSLTINDLIYLMISISDNVATNYLIQKAGMKEINDLMKSLAMKVSTLGRMMQGYAATGEQQENWATPNEYAALIRALLNGTVASEVSTLAMLKMLEGQKNIRRIGRYANGLEGVRWGAKAGTIAGVANDVGFVETEKGTLIASVFCEGLPDMYASEQFIGGVVLEAMRNLELLPNQNNG